ncbi:hypothetical protein SteCoe_4348 [Stentor coeruleus]|uniref:DUF4378 domain-containing protein n=1 Tax=Stentor coeruleus TaxID=5963 RepID=A0A1R2CUW7_9CILI|nr:hypothetical protein SteCoe_4348 [Stentor coeruleus]
MCSLDVNTTIKLSSKSPHVPITGKKIISSIQVPINVKESSPPNKIYIKKQTQDKGPSPRKTPRNTSCLRSSSAKRQIKENKSSSKKSGALRKSFIQIPSKPKPEKPPKQVKVPQIDIIKQENPYSSQTTLRPKLRQIIKKTLKKEKIKKIRTAKEKRGIAEMKVLKKQEISNQNIQIRYENAKCKKIKLKHKYCWGADQSRLKDPQVLKDNTSKSSARKSRSTERVRTGLDAIKEIQIELGHVHLRSRTLSQKSEDRRGISKNKDENKDFKGQEISQGLKIKHQPNPKVIEFMKKKDITRKEKILYEDLQKYAEDSRKQTQLDNLEVLRKAMRPKLKGKKIKKKHGKGKRYRREGSRVVHTEENANDSKNIKLVYDAKSYEDQSNECTSRMPGSFRDNRNSSREKIGKLVLSERKTEKKPILKISKANDPETKAAIKIQSHIRRFLVQRRLERDLEYSSADEQVKDILTKVSQHDKSSSISSQENSYDNKKKTIKNLKIDIPSSSQSRKSLSSSVKSIHEDSFSGQNISLLHEIEESKIKYQEKLKQQLITKEAQIQSLEYLKNKEIQDIKIITERMGKDEELSEIISKIIDQRYSQLSALLEENVRKSEKELISYMDTEEREEFESELMEKCQKLTQKFQNESKVVDDLIESFVVKNERENENTLEDRPAIYKPKSKNPIQIHEIITENYDKENLPQNISILSPLPRDSTLIQESTIKHFSSDDEPHDSTNIFAEDFQMSTPSSSRSGYEIRKLNSLSPNNEINHIQNFIKNENPIDSSKQVSRFAKHTEISKGNEILIEEISLEVSDSNPHDSSLIEHLHSESPSLTPDTSIRMLQTGGGYDLYPNLSRFQTYLDSCDENLNLPYQPNTHFNGFDPSEYYPERPSAPLNYLDSESPCADQFSTYKMSPGIGSQNENDIQQELYNDIQGLNIQYEVTPELVVNLADMIFNQLLDESTRNSHFKEISQTKLTNTTPIPILNPYPEQKIQIQTDPASVKSYLIEIFKNSNFQEIHKNLQYPLKQNPLKVLEKLQELEIGNFIETSWITFSDILNLNTYLHIESIREEFREDYLSLNILPHIKKYLTEAEHIHNKLIFDSANEALQKYRPYGLKGYPMPWSLDCRCINKNQDIEKIIQLVINEVYEWSTLQIGMLGREDFLMSNGYIDDELLQQIREERLASVLTEDIVKKDKLWVDYEFEEAQVKLDLADMILEIFAEEMVEILGYE